MAGGRSGDGISDPFFRIQNYFRDNVKKTEIEKQRNQCGDSAEPFRKNDCEFRYDRLACAGTLIIGTLYVATAFICMALAILSMKTLSALEDERRQFAILYRLGTDVKMQKAALFRQTGAFFLMPFAFPFLMTVPLGMIFAKVYEIWEFAGLSRWRVLETSVLISLVVAGIYALYFFITYRIVCDYVVCYDAESSNGERLSR